MGLEKNTAGKWVVFAFDRTDNTPKTGDAANITANVRIDGGAANAVDDVNPTELANGYYIFDITAAEDNGDLILITPASSTADIQVIGVPGAVYTVAPNSNVLGIESDGDLTKCNLVATTTVNTDFATLFTGITSLAEWLGLLAGKQVGDSTALTEIKATGAGSGTYNPVTDSLEGMKDLGDTNWITSVFSITVGAIADAVWDELLTGNSHNISTSAGRRLRQLEQAFIFAEGVIAVQTDGHTCTLDTGAVATADYYHGARLQLEEGTGAGQSRLIHTYSAGRVVVLDSDWTINPDTSTRYSIVGADSHVTLSDSDLATGFVAAAGSTTSITLDASQAVATNDYYNGDLIVFTHGTGAGQSREITDYTSGRVVTMSPALTVAVSTDTVFHIIAAVSAAEIAYEVWEEVISKAAHNTAQSAAKILRQSGDLVQIDGTVSDVAPSTTDFDTDLTQIDSYFDDGVLIFTNGAANAGIGRPVSAYLNTNGNLTFLSPDIWPVTPVNGDDFIIFANHVHPVAQIGTAVWASATRILTASTNFNDVSAAQVNAQVVDVMNVDLLVAGKTITDALKYIGATSAGVIITAGDPVEIFKDFAGNVAVSITVDASGNRSSIVYA